MTKGEHIQEIWEYVENLKHESFDVPTPEELIQKP
jgi:hypothetical protein